MREECLFEVEAAGEAAEVGGSEDAVAGDEERKGVFSKGVANSAGGTRAASGLCKCTVGGGVAKGGLEESLEDVALEGGAALPGERGEGCVLASEVGVDPLLG
jgi:hypothetical protein